MSPPPDLAELAARKLARESANVPNTRSNREAETVERVAQAIGRRESRALRARRLTAGIALLAAAAVIVVAGRTWLWRAPAPLGASGATSSEVTTTVESVVGSTQIVREGAPASLGEGQGVRKGDELVVPVGGKLLLALSTGTNMTVEGGGDLAVVDQGSAQVYRLSSGAVRAHVHKLAQGERFVVRTPDAEVEVRGTTFRVALAAAGDPCAEGTTTRVQVEEGVVTVRAGSGVVRVAAGESWPPGCSASSLAAAQGASLAASPIASSEPPAASTMAPAAPLGPDGNPSSSSQALTPRGDRSTLAAENDLYARAVQARQTGDTATALSLLERFVAAYPSSPLAENAWSERMKLLSATQRPEAVRAAEGYLARYPSGFARKDAESIVAHSKSPR